MLKILSLVLILIYVSVEYFQSFSLEVISPYGVYWFEAAWVLLIWIVFKGIRMAKKPARLDAILLFSLAPLGWAVHFFAQQSGLLIPFDFTNVETLLFLLCIGPLLEEFVFRGAGWRLIEVWVPNRMILALLTSAAFSYSHFHALFSGPEEYKSFILYQTGYTFMLGLVCSRLRIEGGVMAAVAGHALFNFGFWLAS